MASSRIHQWITSFYKYFQINGKLLFIPFQLGVSILQIAGVFMTWTITCYAWYCCIESLNLFVTPPPGTLWELHHGSLGRRVEPNYAVVHSPINSPSPPSPILSRGVWQQVHKKLKEVQCRWILDNSSWQHINIPLQYHVIIIHTKHWLSSSLRISWSGLACITCLCNCNVLPITISFH